MEAVPLDLQPGGCKALELREGRKPRRQQPEALGGEAVIPLGVLPTQGVVQRVDADRERRLALELGRSPADDRHPCDLGAPAGLADQRRLPDPRLA